MIVKEEVTLGNSHFTLVWAWRVRGGGGIIAER